MRALAVEEGIFCGVSSGGSVFAALELSTKVENATIVAIVCDRVIVICLLEFSLRNKELKHRAGKGNWLNVATV